MRESQPAKHSAVLVAPNAWALGGRLVAVTFESRTPKTTPSSVPWQRVHQAMHEVSDGEWHALPQEMPVSDQRLCCRPAVSGEITVMAPRRGARTSAGALDEIIVTALAACCAGTITERAGVLAALTEPKTMVIG